MLIYNIQILLLLKDYRMPIMVVNWYNGNIVAVLLHLID